MEHVECCLSAELFDKAVYGGLDDLPVLKEGGDLAVYVKPKATVAGKPAVVITFTVQQVDGSLARAQCVVTYGLLEMVTACIRGWKAEGRL